MRKKSISSILLLMVISFFTFAVNAQAASQASFVGDVYYPDTPKITGPLHVIISTSNQVGPGGVVEDRTYYSYDPWGTFHFNISTSIADGTYYMFTFVDGDSDGGYDQGAEPFGYYQSGSQPGQVTVLSGVVNPSNIPMNIHNESGMSFLNIMNPDEGESYYYANKVNVVVQTDVGDPSEHIDYVEFYVDDTYMDYRSNWNYNTQTYDKPFNTSWDWWPSYSDVSGSTHQIKVYSRQYIDGSGYVIKDTATVNIYITDQQVRKIGGEVDYFGSTSIIEEDDKLIIAASISNTVV
ncbi:MAG: hypothetical protein JW871_00745, partial [Endomicrobiales bacterium]|nr:hypothetical protein [Endomicrobiales bacterium]